MLKSKMFKFIAILLIQAILVLDCMPIHALAQDLKQDNAKQIEMLSPDLRVGSADIKIVFSDLQVSPEIPASSIAPVKVISARPSLVGMGGKIFSATRKAFRDLTQSILIGVMLIGLGIGIAGFSTNVSAAQSQQDNARQTWVQTSKQGTKSERYMEWEALLGVSGLTEEQKYQQLDEKAEEIRLRMADYSERLSKTDFFQRRGGNIRIKVKDHGGRLSFDESQLLPGEDYATIKNMPQRRLNALGLIISEVADTIPDNELPEVIRIKVYNAGSLRFLVKYTLVGMYACDNESFLWMRKEQTPIVWANIPARGRPETEGFTQDKGEKVAVILNSSMGSISGIGTFRHERQHLEQGDTHKGKRGFLLDPLDWVKEIGNDIPSWEVKPFEVEGEFYLQFEMDVEPIGLIEGYRAAKWYSIITGLMTWVVLLALSVVIITAPIFLMVRRSLRKRGIREDIFSYIKRNISQGVGKAFSFSLESLGYIVHVFEQALAFFRIAFEFKSSKNPPVSADQVKLTMLQEAMEMKGKFAPVGLIVRQNGEVLIIRRDDANLVIAGAAGFVKQVPMAAHFRKISSLRRAMSQSGNKEPVALKVDGADIKFKKVGEKNKWFIIRGVAGIIKSVPKAHRLMVGTLVHSSI